MENNIENIATVVKDCLIDEPQKGVNQLINFAKSFAINKKLKHRAIALKFEYDELGDSVAKSNIIEDLLNLADEILSDYQHNYDSFEHKTNIELKNNISQYYKNIEPQKDVVFSAVNIEKEFKKSDFKLTNINLQLRLGEITGVVGENGNGKTTLFRIVVGELASDKGEFCYPYLQDGGEINWYNIKNHIAYVPQEHSEWYGSLRDNIQYECSIHGIMGKKNDEQTDYIIYRLGLGEHISKSWNELSGGFKLRFSLAKALVWKPKLLVIDEPLANLDINSQLVLLNDLRDLANSLKDPVSILLSSQHLFEIESISDNLLFLKNGVPSYYGKMEDLGKQRNTNTYELICPASTKALESVFSNLKIVGIEYTGKEYIIRTELTVTHSEILSVLIEANIEIVYFRNISKSIKELFV